MLQTLGRKEENDPWNLVRVKVGVEIAELWYGGMIKDLVGDEPNLVWFLIRH